MKVIDLLNKIANGEEVPKKIKYKDNIFIAKGNGINGFVDYVCEELDYCFFHYINWDTLNDKVEVIEEDKKIEKADLPYYFEIGVNKHKDVEHIYNQCVKIHDNTVYLENKLNEIIDKLNKGE